MLRCVIIDSHEATRVALLERFDASTLVTIVGSAGSPVEGARLIEQERPDLAIVDVQVRTSGRLATLEELDRYGLETPIVAFSARITPSYVAEVFRGGARAFVAKDAPPSILEMALVTVSDGRCFLDPEIAILVLDASSTPSTPLERALLAKQVDPSATEVDTGELDACGDAASDRCAEGIRKRLLACGIPVDVCQAIAMRADA